MISTDASRKDDEMGKAKKGRPPGYKNKKAQTWVNQYETISVRSDISTYELWGKEIGIERIDEARNIRRETMKMLSLRNRSVDAGGRVTVEAAYDETEHVVLDTMLKKHILDDPNEPLRSRWRHEAGIALLALWRAAKRNPHVTASHRAVGGGRSGGVSQEEAEGHAARCETRYYRALDACGELDSLMQTICCYAVLPMGTKTSRVLTGLDLLAEFFFDHAPPAGILRPRVRSRRKVEKVS